MKKKIKDLNREEMKKLCQKNKNDYCNGCPLFITEKDSAFQFCFRYLLDDFNLETLNDVFKLTKKEIEVEENK